MSVEPLVLAVDDEAGVLRLLKLELTSQGFRVLTASNADEAEKIVSEHRPDIALLDVMMPGTDGLELMRRIREHRSELPILLVTAKDSDLDKVRGLELGADDYIVKPFSLDELAARVRAVLRRETRGKGTGGLVRRGELEIDLDRRLVKKGGELVSLSRTEWLLLQHLASNAGRVMLGPELLSRVWGPEYRDDSQYLRVWVSRVRQKIEPTPAEPTVIKTFQGIGYMFQADANVESETAGAATGGR